MLGDPAPAAHTDGRHLALIDPDPRQSCKSLSSQPEHSHHIDHHLLQLTQVPVQIHPVAMEIQNGIDHKLPRSVMRDLPSSIDAVEGGWRLTRIKEEMGV